MVKKKKNPGYKIKFDFNVIYTKHMLIIYLKIIQLFFSTKQIFVHDPLTTKQCRVLDFRIWTTATSKNPQAAASCIAFWGEILDLYTIYKQTTCLFGSFQHREPWCIWADECVQRVNTPEAVGSRHLCFESQHSYYGFHVACKVLCICFDQSLFGMPPHITMLGIYLLRTSKARKALFGKHDFAFENIVMIIFKDYTTHF